MRLKWKVKGVGRYKDKRRERVSQKTINALKKLFVFLIYLLTKQVLSKFRILFK